MGIFEHRGVPVPAIHLAKFLGERDYPVAETAQVLILEFNNRHAGFIVESTKKIRKVSWNRVLPPSSDCLEGITGMTLIEDSEFLFILDFEMILERIEGRSYGQNMDSGKAVEAIKKMRSPNQKVIMLVDDSATARKALSGMLSNSIFELIEAKNGIEALHLLNQYHDEMKASGSNKLGIDLIITDLEMPQMDGLTLTSKIKEDPNFENVPIIMHSSLSGQANVDKGEKAGCDYYVVKFNQKEVIAAITDALKLG